METIDMKKIVQLGIVVKDVRQAMKEFCSMFGVDEDYTMLISVKEGERGSRFTADFGWVNFAGIQFEFIQPIGGDLGDYNLFLEETGGGVHHIAFTSHDPISSLAYLRSSDAKEVTPGSESGKIINTEVGYFDFHDTMGLRFEITSKDIEQLTSMSFRSPKGK